MKLEKLWRMSDSKGSECLVQFEKGDSMEDASRITDSCLWNELLLKSGSDGLENIVQHENRDFMEKEKNDREMMSNLFFERCLNGLSCRGGKAVLYIFVFMLLLLDLCNKVWNYTLTSLSLLKMEIFQIIIMEADKLGFTDQSILESTINYKHKSAFLVSNNKIKYDLDTGVYESIAKRLCKKLGKPEYIQTVYAMLEQARYADSDPCSVLKIMRAISVEKPELLSDFHDECKELNGNIVKLSYEELYEDFEIVAEEQPPSSHKWIETLVLSVQGLFKYRQQLKEMAPVEVFRVQDKDSERSFVNAKPHFHEETSMIKGTKLEQKAIKAKTAGYSDAKACVIRETAKAIYDLTKKHSRGELSHKESKQSAVHNKTAEREQKEKVESLARLDLVSEPEKHCEDLEKVGQPQNQPLARSQDQQERTATFLGYLACIFLGCLAAIWLGCLLFEMENSHTSSSQKQRPCSSNVVQEQQLPDQSIARNDIGLSENITSFGENVTLRERGNLGLDSSDDGTRGEGHSVSVRDEVYISSTDNGTLDNGGSKYLLFTRFWIVTPEMFEHAERETRLAYFSLDYVIFHPNDVRLPVYIPAFRDYYLSRKEADYSNAYSAISS